MGRCALPGVLLLSALLWTGCGLPEPFYLSPPTATPTTDPSTGVFVFQHTDHSTEVEFRGYELYYKLYADVNTAATEAASLGGPTKTVDDLLQKGFLTLCRGPGTLAQDSSVGARATPFLAIDQDNRGSSFTITVTFDPGGTDGDTNVSYAEPLPALHTVSQEIDRHVDVTTRCKPFTFGNYASSDADFYTINGSIQDQLLYIVVYVASYGLQDLSTPIFSYPVALGYLRFSSFF